jgi:hypothetical protein
VFKHASRVACSINAPTSAGYSLCSVICRAHLETRSLQGLHFHVELGPGFPALSEIASVLQDRRGCGQLQEPTSLSTSVKAITSHSLVSVLLVQKVREGNLSKKF